MGYYLKCDPSPELGYKLSRYSCGYKHVCPICGKGFVIQGAMHRYWRYKGYVNRCVKYFCSYGCKMKFDKEMRKD